MCGRGGPGRNRGCPGPQRFVFRFDFPSARALDAKTLKTWTTNASGTAAVLNNGTNPASKVSTNQFLRVARTAPASGDAS